MNLIVSYSGRKNGNSDRIADYILSADDQVLFIREISTSLVQIVIMIV